VPAVSAKVGVDEGIPIETIGHTNPNIYRNLIELQEFLA